MLTYYATMFQVPALSGDKYLLFGLGGVLDNAGRFTIALIIGK